MPRSTAAYCSSGNSLTEANGLPALVETLSRQGGGTPISTAGVAFAGFSLEDHWNQGTAQRRIAEGGWSIVLLQQGPSALLESQVALREWAVRFDSVIRASGARTALYMVWPESNRRDVFDAVSRSYARAAEEITGILLPVGEAWRAAWRRDPDVPLYGGLFWYQECQIPSSKSQAPTHSQLPTPKFRPIGIWRLGVRWDLDLGSWDLTFYQCASVYFSLPPSSTYS